VIEQMAGLVKTLAVILVAGGACVTAFPPAYAAEAAPLGAWRTTNGCFLVAFILMEGGRAQAAYMTGEQDENAAWTWEGGMLKIASRSFDLDNFTGRLTNDHIEADYVWHDLDKDQLNRQACIFERFTPLGL
jgi:hypothetical protein